MKKTIKFLDDFFPFIMLFAFVFILGFSCARIYYSDLIVMGKGVEMLNRDNISCYGMSCDTVCDCCLECKEDENSTKNSIYQNYTKVYSDHDWSVHAINVPVYYMNGSVYAYGNLTYYEETTTWYNITQH